MNRTPLALLAFAAGAAPASGYMIVDLGSLSGWTEARALNEEQIVVGSSVNDGWQSRGFVWGLFLEAVDPPAPLTQTEAMGINALSDAVVAAYSMGDVQTRALLVGGGSTTEMGSFVPRAINAAGLVVGTADVLGADGFVSMGAVVWDNGSLTQLPQYAGGHDASALDVSETGLVVGSAFANEVLEPTAVAWSGGSVMPLGTLGGAYAQATGVSGGGEFVCGVSATAAAGRHAFRYRMSGGSVAQRVDLGTLSGGWSVAYDVNDAGWVVGTSDGRAFLSTGGHMYDLNTMIDPALGWTLVGASGINERGDIVGWGEHGADGIRAFILVQPCSTADIAPVYGRLDALDEIEFITRFEAGEPGADIAPEYGSLDFFDLLAFLRIVDAGCP